MTAPFILLGHILKTVKLVERLNELGVLCRHEVSGVQYQFKLTLAELEPSSLIFVPNRRHVKDTVYTLIPGQDAAAISKVGRCLFKRLREAIIIQKREQYDFVKTPFGIYISLNSIAVLEKAADLIEREMRIVASKLIRGKYVEYYSQAFRIAYSYFRKRNAEFRKNLKIFDASGGLSWSELARIYRELADWDNEIRRATNRRKLIIRDITDPEQKLAYKLIRLPRSETEYLDSIRVSIRYVGFHRFSFGAPNKDFKGLPKSFNEACDLLQRLGH